MENKYPVYTVLNDCQDCYKCIRYCPVKAIKVENGSARVVPELCISCGVCVEVCPSHAKKIRDDLGRVRDLLASGKKVIVSLAPSWVSEFPEVEPSGMVAAIKRLGFYGVSETALGAQEVTASLVERFSSHPEPGLYLSSACPVAVSYIEKYHPSLTSSITQIFSPVLAHCRLLRKKFGDDIAIVFIGPCVGKKIEADRYPDLLDVAITFLDLRKMLEESEIDPGEISYGSDDLFMPERAREGAIYPIEGGMIKSIKAYGSFSNIRFVSLSGLDNIKQAVSDFRVGELDYPLFVECLACSGGCINGPCSNTDQATLSRRMEVESFVKMPEEKLSRVPSIDVVSPILSQTVEVEEPDEETLLKALAKVGKTSIEDELNCGGCGYDSCREFARAMIEGKAEPRMCASYMRNLAQKKANALLRTIPAGVVIVDSKLRIIECNEEFARMAGSDKLRVYKACPGLGGSSLVKIFPIAHLFEGVLEVGEDIHYEHFRYGRYLFDITIFIIDPYQVVGAILVDVTKKEMKRDQIAQRANEVIKKNLSTVQEIACKLGEHMADTEILLRSIAEGYAAEDVSDPDGKSEE